MIWPRLRTRDEAGRSSTATSSLWLSGDDADWSPQTDDDRMDLVWPGVAAHGGDGRDTLIGRVPGQLLGEAGDDTLKMYMGIMGTLDGGDVLKVGRSIYVGQGGRTNAEGIAQLRAAHGTLEAGTETDTSVAVAGRIMLLRDSGKLVFATVRDRDDEVQLFVSKAVVGDDAFDEHVPGLDQAAHL